MPNTICFEPAIVNDDNEAGLLVTVTIDGAEHQFWVSLSQCEELQGYIEEVKELAEEMALGPNSADG